MTFWNIHRQCGYFSKDKTNSSLQLFITRTIDMPGDAVMERKMYTAKKEIAGWCKLPVIATGDISYQQHLDGHDHLNLFFLNAQPHASNISTQHLPTLMDRVVWCCEGACQTRATSCNIQKCCNKTLTIFKLDPIPSKMHVATFCYRMAKRVKRIVRNNVAKYCVCLTGHLKCF